MDLHTPITSKTMDMLLALSLALMAVSTSISLFDISPQSQMAQVTSSLDGSVCDFSRDIVHRSTGDDVVCLQNYLIEEGYLGEGEYSFFNPTTRHALRDWQEDNDLYRVGWFGEVSKRVYNDLQGIPNDPIPECSFDRDLVHKTDGDDVKCLQVYLWSEGHYENEGSGFLDSFTRRAIKSWQEEHGLEETGDFEEVDHNAYQDILSGTFVTPSYPDEEVEEDANEPSDDDTSTDTEEDDTDVDDTENNQQTEEDPSTDPSTDETTNDTSAESGECTFTRDLVWRSNGTDVTCLQNYLIGEGLLNSAPSGNYLRLTLDAVRAWQTSRGIGDNGNWGPISQIIYNDEHGNPTDTAPTCTFDRDIVSKTRGDDVQCLQVYLYLNGHYTYEATGYFGTLSRNAVRSWQAAAGVPVTGNFDYASRVKYAELSGQEVPPLPPVSEDTTPEEDTPTPTEDQTPPSDTTPIVATVAGAKNSSIPVIEDLQANTWYEHGRPWRDIDPGREVNCGVDFAKVLGAWNGGVWDGDHFWNWAGGGHGDGCFNGLIRYNIEEGKAETIVPHEALNVPWCRGPFTKANGEVDCYFEPYVSDVSLSDNDNIKKATRIIQSDPPRETILRPRSSHMYNNMTMNGDWIYLVIGHVYVSTKIDNQVWRVNAAAYDKARAAGASVAEAQAAAAATIERLPDRTDSQGEIIGGFNVNWVKPDGEDPFMAGGSMVCEVDIEEGEYDCERQNYFLSGSATTVWDEERGGFWAVDSNLDRILFIRENGNRWEIDNSLSRFNEPRLGKNLGQAGICLVPTDKGTNPVMWGNHSQLLRWDGTSLSVIDVPGGPGHADRRKVYNKWSWNEDEGVCMGTASVDEGMWVFKPDFTDTSIYLAEGESLSGANTDSSDSEPDTEPVPTPEPVEEPEPTPAPTDPVDPVSTERINVFESEGYFQPGAYPTVAGITISPREWDPAAWDERIERQPEAPDYNRVCPGSWREMHVREDADMEGLYWELRSIARSGVENMRVYVHPLRDTDGRVVAYEGTERANSFRMNDFHCAEVIGVENNGEKPQLNGSVSYSGGGGLIVRGIAFATGEGVGWTGSRATNIYPEFIVIHDSHMSERGQLMGDSPTHAPYTYLEFRGNVIGNNTDWHLIYLERSIGNLVALSNVFYGSGNSGHSFKNLAHESRLEGNVFSNVDIDGQPLAYDKNDREVTGLMPLDLYACTNTIVRDNTVVFRTSGNVRSFAAYRARRAWGGCDKGERNGDGVWDIWPPESREYDDPKIWAEIAEAAESFEDGYEEAKKEPWLFTHLNEGNRYIVFNKATRGNGEVLNDTDLASIRSLRPVADNTVKAEIDAEARALSKECELLSNPTTCFENKMSPALQYAYEHLDESWQRAMVKIGSTPRGVPIKAPDEWIERAGLYVGENEFITCNAEGTSCNRNTERFVDSAPREWDEVEVASPPRVYKYN